MLLYNISNRRLKIIQVLYKNSSSYIVRPATKNGTEETKKLYAVRESLTAVAIVQAGPSVHQLRAARFMRCFHERSGAL